MRMRLASPVLAAAALAIGAGPAAAHGGDTALVHSCIGGDGNVKVIAAEESCKKNEVALDWARDGGGTTYTAGFGLALSPANELSVTGAPWGGLIDVPGGFADGIDDDGSAAVNALRGELAADDGVPDEPDDPVSFSQIKDLTSTSGNGRITGAFVRDGSLTGTDIEDGTLTGADLAERTISGSRIATGSIDSDHFAPGVLERRSATLMVDPPHIAAGSRVAVPVPDMFNLHWGPEDIVTVSPPAGLEPDLVYAGSDVLTDGTLVVYLHNITPGGVDGAQRDWKVRVLKVGG